MKDIDHELCTSTKQVTLAARLIRPPKVIQLAYHWLPRGLKFGYFGNILRVKRANCGVCPTHGN